MASRPVSLKLLPRTTVKAKSVSRIAARVLGGDGIIVEKANGAYTISVDAANLPAVVGLVIGVDVQAYDTDLQALANNSTNGMWARTGSGTGSARTITGTAAEITVTNGDGVSGNPTVSIPAAVTLTGKTLTGGNFASPTISGAATITASASVTNQWVFDTTSSNATTIMSTDAGAAAGPQLNIFRSSASPAVNDLTGFVGFFGTNSAPTFFEYARVGSQILDPVAASEDGRLTFQTAVAGTLADRGYFGQGFIVGAPTGGDKGSGTINAAGVIYSNNVAALLATDIGSSVQAFDSDLAAVAALSSTGLVARTGSGTAAVRTLTAPAAGLTITNPAGVAGDPTFVLANDLSALEGLGSTGFAARTATDTWAQRALAASTGLTWTNPAGIAGNPSINFDIPSLTVDSTPDSAADYLLTYDASASAYKKALISSVVGAAAAGVTSLNGQTGALTLPATYPATRLSLTSGVALTESDVTAATTIYYGITSLDIYDGTNFVPTFISSELSLALDSNSGHAGYHQSGKNYFLGVINDAGTRRLVSSVAWATDTTTGTGAGTCETEIFLGRLVNKVSMTVRFGSVSGNTVSVAARQMTIVGGFRASADGQVTDSYAKRFLSNIYNAELRPLRVQDATATWSYASATIRQANGSTANQLAWFHCVSGRMLQAYSTGRSESVQFAGNYIGLDSTTVAATGSIYAGAGAVQYQPLIAELKTLAGIGYHFAAWLENSPTAASVTFTGASTSGINGMVSN
jgi:hypothetical protein